MTVGTVTKPTLMSRGAAASLACAWEVTAPKPGNVYRGADFDDVTYEEQEGGPGDYKLFDSDVMIVAFVPEDVSIESLGNPPSMPNLEGATGREGTTTLYSRTRHAIP